MEHDGFNTELQLLDPPTISFEDINDVLDTVDFDDELDSCGLIDELSNCSILFDTYESSDPETVNEMRCQLHFTRTQCDHTECSAAISMDMARGFAGMDLVQRISAVRAILYALTTVGGEQNSLMKESTIASRKRQRNEGESAYKRTTTAYALRGKRMCLQAFSAVTQISKETVRRHAKEVSVIAAPVTYSTKKATSRNGKYGVQRVVVKAFLLGVARDFGMECPWGRGSKDESPLRFLPSHFTKTKLYQEYCDSWSEIYDAIIEHLPRFSKPIQLVSYSLYVRYWQEDMPLPRIASTGSDFCDTCTTLRDTIQSLAMNDVRARAASDYLERHLRDARTEFRLYKQHEENSRLARKQDLRHFVFDFAEKVLLPKLQKQPGQLHFITGLKFDFFGVTNSNDGETDIYGLVEGHWPSEKKANTVISMLHLTISKRSPFTNARGYGARLALHADNCSGQNKNRFVVFYLLWRVIMGYEDEVTLYFLVAGHTKNVCDGAFGHVKRRLRSSDTLTPSDMIHVVQSSATNNCCIRGSEVHWRDWKRRLSKYFTVPSTFRISTGHVFTARSSNPGRLFMKELSTTVSEKSFKFLNSGIAPTRDDLSNPLYNLTMTPLRDVPSKQHGTRHNYLKVNILDRYYPNNEAVKTAFLKTALDGTVT